MSMDGGDHNPFLFLSFGSAGWALLDKQSKSISHNEPQLGLVGFIRYL